MNRVHQQLHKNRSRIFRLFNLRSLAIFGSYARNTFSSGSDVDLVYATESNQTLSFRQVVQLENMIREVTGIEEIDLVNERNMNPIVWLTVRNDLVYV